VILRKSASFCSFFSPSKGLVLQNVWAQERTVLEYSGSLQNIGDGRSATSSTSFVVDNYMIVLRGDRFLYKMCRFIVGIIVAAGYGKVRIIKKHS